MISKILFVALLVACSQALQYDNHQATSSVSFNQHHNTIHHIQSAPTLVKTVAAPVHAVPIAYKSAAPVYSAPHSQASSYSSLSLAHGGPSAAHYTSPISSSLSFAPVAKVAAPVLFKAAAPAQHASSYSSLSVSHSAPAVHHIAPVASVSKIVAAPAIHAAPSFHFSPSVHSAPAVHVAPAVHAAPAVYASAHHQEEYAHPKYEFAYGVEDHHTGDIHSQKEVRDGDVTQGEYSLHEADGTIRTVKYTVDKHSGFNAIVERTGHATHAQPAPVAKAIVAAPAYSHYHH